MCIRDSYLSDAAGFIINMETEVRGRVDVWSNQPLSHRQLVHSLVMRRGR